MANIDKLIINDPSASEPTNPLEMYIAKINGTYTGDIPEPTNDLEKALAQVAESGSGEPAAEWPKLRITCSSVPEAAADNIRFAYPTNNGTIQMTTMADVISIDEMIIPTPYVDVEGTHILMGYIKVMFNEDGDTLDWNNLYVSTEIDTNADVYLIPGRGTAAIDYRFIVSSLSDIPTILVGYNGMD